MNTTYPHTGARLTLWADTAADLMASNPVSVREDAAVHDAMALLIDKGFSAAPVIDDAGRPVGVVSRSDILIHERQRVEHVPPVPEYYDRHDLATAAGEPLPRGFQVEKVDRTRVADIMTPAVFAVTPEAPVARVLAEFQTLKVHRLFVVDDGGVLVGVISALDVLKRLRA